MSFGKNLSKTRKTRGWTQEVLARKSTINISQIRKYETERSAPTVNVIAKLAIALGVSTDELIFDDGEGVSATRILDKDLLNRFEKVLNLSEDDIKTVKNLIDGLIVKHQVKEIADENKISTK